MFLSELFFTIMVLVLNLNINFFQNNFIGIFIINILILALTYLILKNKYIDNIFNNIVKWCGNNKVIKVVAVCIIAELTMFFLIYQNS